MGHRDQTNLTTIQKVHENSTERLKDINELYWRYCEIVQER